MASYCTYAGADPGLPLGGFPLSQKTRPFFVHIRQSDSQTELQQLRVNEVQIFAKLSESTAQLASILVREVVLLIQMSARVNQISALNV